MTFDEVIGALARLSGRPSPACRVKEDNGVAEDVHLCRNSSKARPNVSR